MILLLFFSVFPAMTPHFILFTILSIFFLIFYPVSKIIIFFRKHLPYASIGHFAGIRRNRLVLFLASGFLQLPIIGGCKQSSNTSIGRLSIMTLSTALLLPGFLFYLLVFLSGLIIIRFILLGPRKQLGHSVI